MPWNEDLASSGAPLCEHCVQYDASVELQVLQNFDLCKHAAPHAMD